MTSVMIPVLYKSKNHVRLFICIDVYSYVQRKRSERTSTQMSTIVTPRGGGCMLCVRWVGHSAFISVSFAFFYWYVLFL